MARQRSAEFELFTHKWKFKLPRKGLRGSILPKYEVAPPWALFMHQLFQCEF